MTLDAGKNKGLLKGMKLRVTQPADVFESVAITKVDETTAEGVMTQIGEEEPGPEKGWRLSTRYNWAGDKPQTTK